jgi:hypothetical protein
MKCRLLVTAVLFSIPLSALPAPAREGKRETLVDNVRKGIDRGIKYLRSKQLKDGSWEIDEFAKQRPGGWTCLSMLALLNAGVPPEDKMMKRGLDYIRQLEPSFTYVRALQTMVFAEARQNQDKERIQRNVDWLMKAAVRDNTGLLGWTYTQNPQVPDNSNTQYALLGLHAGKTAGAKIPDSMWKDIRNYYKSTQINGGWVYAKHHNNFTYLTMDTAGLCGLIIAGMELNSTREQPLGNGRFANCGKYKESKHIRAALNEIGRPTVFTVDFENRVYYNLYGIERAGRLSGQRFLAGHDWYREGAKFLVKLQDKEEGCWPGKGFQFDRWPVVNTSFALLFLSKGRTPVLISKIAHDCTDARSPDDWNNDRNDAKHLTEYISRELFKRRPLAWQIYDVRQADLGNEDKILDAAAELLQSPIAYFNGHKAPEFRPAQLALLKEYVDNGGFIFAEACCSQPEFGKGLRAMVEDKDFLDAELVELEPNHPVWTAFYDCRTSRPRGFKLYGVKRGCKTVLIFSPQDLSCSWESKRTDAPGEYAFRVGANIAWYATGGQLPDDKGTEKDVTKPVTGSKKLPRNFLKVAQLEHGGDWQPAPKAMRNLLDFMEKDVGLNVDKQRETIRVDNPDLVDFKFLYMHGNQKFAFKSEQLKKLRFNLETGGLLFADACCGREPFDKAFREFAQQLFPDKKLEPIPLDDDLYGADLNGEKLDDRNIRCRTRRADGRGANSQYRAMAPALEGIKIGNRWVVMYSKYDIGCALEKYKSTDCVGYDPASALKLGKAAVLYALKR